MSCGDVIYPQEENGKVSEDTYLRKIRHEQNGAIDIAALKTIIRDNFEEIEGMIRG
jgi:hypothetical protein